MKTTNNPAVRDLVYDSAELIFATGQVAVLAMRMGITQEQLADAIKGGWEAAAKVIEEMEQKAGAKP